jgi:HAD superfamily hydrolase (TIGR01509 family)
MVGTIDGWDIWGHLEELAGAPLDREALNTRRVEHELSLLEAEGLRPGIAEYLEASERLGLRRAIVSSSSRGWIDRHLARLGREAGWDAIVTADFDVARAKPHPTLYLEALELLGVQAGEAVAFEDSPNGALAATAAGIFTVGVPNAITRDLGLDAADLVVESLADLPPEQLLVTIRTRTARSGSSSSGRSGSR